MIGEPSGRRFPHAPPDRGAHPPLRFPPYTASLARAPTLPPVAVPPTATELAAAAIGDGWPVGGDDLTTGAPAPPIGERIIVAGRVVDGSGGPVAGALLEVWQANAAGRYVHESDQRAAPLDPSFRGCGGCVTDAEGWYRFVTIRPGCYPGRSHHNAWRPAHIHFSVIGDVLLTRLVTQMYFPGDPLLAHDPIFLAVPEPARPRLVADLALDLAEPDVSLAYRFDIVVRGTGAAPEDG